MTGRIFRVEHYLPRLADHAQASGRLLAGELRAPAIYGLDAPAFQFTQTVLNGVEIVVHQAEEGAPDHEAEARKRSHDGGIEIVVASLRFELAPLVERSAVKKLAQAAASTRGLHHALKRRQPLRHLGRLRPKYRLEHMRHVFQIDFGIFHARGCAE